MPLGEIAVEVLGGAVRFVGHVFLEFVVEFLIRGPGYFLCKWFKKDVRSDDGIVVFAGLVFWIVVGVGAGLIFQEVSAFVAVDKCLDSGGAFDYSLQKCVYE